MRFRWRGAHTLPTFTRNIANELLSSYWPRSYADMVVVADEVAV